MGLGRFGGGVGVTRFLVQQGAHVLVTDQSPESDLKKSVVALAGLDVSFRLGKHHVDDFTNADLIVVNPAVKPVGNPYLQAATDAGVPLTSEIRLLVERLPNPNRVIGITGSAGKSTVTAMVGLILANACKSNNHRCFVGGNIGGSLLGEIESMKHDDWVVLELSSFMLDSLCVDNWSPHIAVVTNLSPNHIDWHGSIDAYYDAKRHILRHQQPDDFAVLGPGVSDVFQSCGQCAALNTDVETPTIPLLLPGRHNQLNARLALATTNIAGVPHEHAVASLAEFPGLPHRLQFVCERGGVRYLNDSKSTTPEAAILAIESFPPDVVHVILGGDDKKSDLTTLSANAKARCKAIYTIGLTGEGIANAASAADGSAEVIRCQTLDRAVESTMPRIAPGDVVLLSPACASWDQFTNYEQRGQRFVEAVLNYTGEGASPPRSAASSK